MELLLALVNQLNSSVFTLIVVLLFALWGMYKLGGIVSVFMEFKDKHKNFDASISTIKDDISAIKATTDLLYQTHLSTIQSHSPLSLTDKGKKISSELNVERTVTKHWGEIKDLVERSSPSNPYDIQTVAMEIAKNCFGKIFSEDERNTMKTYAFGTGMNLLEIIPIIGIVIRDKFLKER